MCRKGRKAQDREAVIARQEKRSTNLKQRSDAKKERKIQKVGFVVKRAELPAVLVAFSIALGLLWRSSSALWLHVAERKPLFADSRRQERVKFWVTRGAHVCVL